jgi:hypothetical protein
MNNLAGDFIWRVPKQGFRLESGIHRRPAARYARGGVSFVSFEGPHENNLAFYGVPNDFIVPNIADLSELPSGLVYEFAKDALSFVLSGSEADEYRPLVDCPALFREFASIEPTDENFLNFSNRWGALGSEGTCNIILLDAEGHEIDEYSRIWGEVVGLFEIESGNLHDAVALWDAARHGQNEVLENSIWVEEDTVCWHSVPDGWAFTGGRWVSAPEHYPERFEQIERHGLARAAMYIVQDLVNEGLRARVHEQMQWDEALERPMIRITPINLIGAMWLQLASAVQGDREYGQCSVCNGWFEVSPGSGRPDKRYCSDACRMRAYRKRRKANQQKQNG